MAYRKLLDPARDRVRAAAVEDLDDLLAAFALILDNQYENNEHLNYADNLDEDGNEIAELHEDSAVAWTVWRKLAGDDRVPDDVLALLDSKAVTA